MKTAVEQIFDQHDNTFNKMNFLRWLSGDRRVMLKIETSIAEKYAKTCVENEKEGRPFIKFRDFIELQNIDPNANGSYNSPM